MMVLSDTSAASPLVSDATFPLTLEVISADKTYVRLLAFGVRVYLDTGDDSLEMSPTDAATSSVRTAFGFSEPGQYATVIKLAPGEVQRIVEAKNLLLAPYQPVGERLAESHLFSLLTIVAIVAVGYLGSCMCAQVKVVALLSEKATTYPAMAHRLDLMRLGFCVAALGTLGLIKIHVSLGRSPMGFTAIAIGSMAAMLLIYSIIRDSIALWGGLVLTWLRQPVGGFQLWAVFGTAVTAVVFSRALYLDVILPAKQKRLLTQAQESAGAVGK
jgi:hypothetical protein